MAATQKPTPGPWKYDGGVRVDAPALSEIVMVKNDSGQECEFKTGMVALVYSCRQPGIFDAGSAAANGRLIAAAPQLLSALNGVIDVMQDLPWRISSRPEFRKAYDDAVAAIAIAVDE